MPLLAPITATTGGLALAVVACSVHPTTGSTSPSPLCALSGAALAVATPVDRRGTEGTGAEGSRTTSFGQTSNERKRRRRRLPKCHQGQQRRQDLYARIRTERVHIDNRHHALITRPRQEGAGSNTSKLALRIS